MVEPCPSSLNHRLHGWARIRIGYSVCHGRFCVLNRSVQRNRCSKKARSHAEAQSTRKNVTTKTRRTRRRITEFAKLLSLCSFCLCGSFLFPAPAAPLRDPPFPQSGVGSTRSPASCDAHVRRRRNDCCRAQNRHAWLRYRHRAIQRDVVEREIVPESFDR